MTVAVAIVEGSIVDDTTLTLDRSQIRVELDDGRTVVFGERRLPSAPEVPHPSTTIDASLVR